MGVQDLVPIVILHFQMYGHDEDDDADGEPMDDYGLVVVEVEEEDLHEVEEEDLHAQRGTNQGKLAHFLVN